MLTNSLPLFVKETWLYDEVALIALRLFFELPKTSWLAFDRIDIDVTEDETSFWRGKYLSSSLEMKVLRN